MIDIIVSLVLIQVGQEVAGVGRLRREKAGFSLLEVVVALIIFGLILLPMGISFALGMQVVTAATLTNKATAIAEGEMEKLRTLGYEELEDRLVFDAERDEYVYSYSEPKIEGFFDMEVEVTPYTPEGGFTGDLLEVVITLVWDDRGRSTSLTVESLIAPEPPEGGA